MAQPAKGGGLAFFFLFYAPFGLKDLVTWAARERERRRASA